MYDVCSGWKREGVHYKQGFTIRQFPGLVNFVPAVAYHFCLNLLAAFSQPGNVLIVWPYTGMLYEHDSAEGGGSKNLKTFAENLC